MKTIALASTTFREIVRRPLFWLIAALAAGLLLLSCFTPYFTFGEDLKMVKDQGLVAITISALALALFAASVSIADEIDGKTAITLLSKPMSRRSFIVGKYLGIMAATAALFGLLSVVFAGTIVYKDGYEARENSREPPALRDRLQEVAKMAPGVVLAYMQVAVIAAFAVAFSTRLPVHWMVSACLAIYLLGNLSSTLVRFAAQQDGAKSAAVQVIGFMAQVFDLVLPSLSVFNIGAAISTDRAVPWVDYVLPAFGYCLLCVGIALALALLMFEDRDLA